MKETISVTQADIDRAREWIARAYSRDSRCDEQYEAYCEHCPISYALMRIYGATRAEVGHSFVLAVSTERTLRTDTTPELLAWMLGWDIARAAHPHEFTVEWSTTDPA